MEERELLKEFVHWLYYKNGAFGIAEVLEDTDDAISRFLDYYQMDSL